MATGQSQKSATLPPRTQPPKPGNQRNKLSSPSFNRSLFGRLVQKLRFRNRDTDSEFPDAQNVEGLYFKRKLSPEHKETPSQGPFARVDVRRSQSDRSYQKPVEMRKKNGAFPKLRRSRHSKEITEVLPPQDKSPMASCLEVSNDFIVSDDAGIDLDDGGKEEPIPLDDMDPGYETLDEVREKMKNLKLKKLKEEEEEAKSQPAIQTHRRTQSAGGQDEARGGENELEISARKRRSTNLSHTDVNRPNSQHLDVRNHLLPNLTSNLLSVRSGSCPLHHDNSLQSAKMGSPNKSENCLSQGGVVWKETEDVYANPSIVHNKTKQSGERKDTVRSSSAINREESVEKEPPPLPERQYSVQAQDDLGSEETCSEDNILVHSTHVVEQNCFVSQETNSESTEVRPELMNEEGNGYSTCGSVLVRPDPMDDEGNGYSACGSSSVRPDPMDGEGNGYSTCGGSSKAPYRRRERIYEEIKDHDINNSQCEADDMCSVPYPSYIRKERPYEDVKDLQIDSGIHNSSSGTDFFAQVMNHFDSLSENVVSSNSVCETYTEDLETDGSASEKACENLEMFSDVRNASSAKTDSAITDLSISLDQPISNINSFTSSAEQLVSETLETSNPELVKQSDLTDHQPLDNFAATQLEESENTPLKQHTESINSSVSPAQYKSPLGTSYEDDADFVLESLHSQAIPSGVSSIENLLEYERAVNDNSSEVVNEDSGTPMSSSGVKSWEEIPFADADVDALPRQPDDGYSECSDVNQGSLAGSLIITEADLGCDQNSASNTVVTPSQSEMETSASEDTAEMMKLPIGAIGGDPKTDNAQDILDEEAEVRWRPKGLPYKSIPSYYYDEEPVHMSLSELGMKEKYNKHSREKERQKRKQKEGKSSSIRQQCSGNSSQVKSSSLSGVKVRDSSLRQTAVHKNPEARRTYPMGMAKSLDSENVHKDLVETKMVKSETSGDKPLRDVKAKSSFVEPVTLPEIPRFNPNSDIRCRKDFLDSMKQLKDCGWYWGPLSWDEAEIKLLNKPDGSFLVRDSSDERYILSLSFNMNGHVHHTRIEHHKGKFSFWSQPDSLGKSTIKEFIEQCVRNSRNGQFLYFIRPSGPGAPPMPVHLLHPVSRFRQMQSLQHMCRFQILQIVRRDHIDRLPIPTSIKDYLRESQYYVEYLED